LPKCSSPDSGASPKCCSLNGKEQHLRELFSPGVGICVFSSHPVWEPSHMVWETIFPSHLLWMTWHYLWHWCLATISSSSNVHIIIWCMLPRARCCHLIDKICTASCTYIHVLS
jgi:hypothetical protein